MNLFGDDSTNKEPFESHWYLPQKTGDGFFRKIEIQPGFDMYIVNCQLRESPVLKSSASSSIICMRFNLSGQNTVKVKGLNQSFSTTRHKNNLFYFNNPETTGHIPKNQHLIGVSLHFDPVLLVSLIGDSANLIPNLLKLVEGNALSYFCHPGFTTPQMHTVVHQLVNCSFYGSTKKLFLESKGLELLSYKLEQIENVHSGSRNNALLKPDQVERIRYASEILIQQMDCPPSLTELARKVGVSRTKLHVDFCKVFGTTPFSYLKEARLHRAKILLDEGYMNVSEAAFAVGYSSLSHFAKAFVQQFGTSPGKYLNDVVPSGRKNLM